MRSASEYNDQDLLDVFWHVDRDKYPERYSEITEELDVRKIHYEDLPQWERNAKNLDEEIVALSEGAGLIGRGYRYIVAVIAVAGFIYAYFDN